MPQLDGGLPYVEVETSSPNSIPLQTLKIFWKEPLAYMGICVLKMLK